MTSSGVHHIVFHQVALSQNTLSEENDPYSQAWLTYLTSCINLPAIMYWLAKLHFHVLIDYISLSIYLTSHLTCLTSHLTCLTSHLTCLTSYVLTYQASCVVWLYLTFNLHDLTFILPDLMCWLTRLHVLTDYTSLSTYMTSHLTYLTSYVLTYQASCIDWLYPTFNFPDLTWLTWPRVLANQASCIDQLYTSLSIYLTSHLTYLTSCVDLPD